MDDEMIQERFNNLDHRLEKIEQILPTLATKEDLKAFPTKDDLTAYATKEDLKAFATKDELRAEGDKSRRHMDVIAESLRGDIQLIAENLAAMMSKRTGG